MPVSVYFLRGFRFGYEITLLKRRRKESKGGEKGGSLRNQPTPLTGCAALCCVVFKHNRRTKPKPANETSLVKE